MKTKILFQFNLWVSGKGDNCHDWSQKVTATDKIVISLLRDCNWLKKVVPLLNLPVENIKQANFGGGCGNMSFDCLVCSFKLIYSIWQKHLDNLFTDCWTTQYRSTHLCTASSKGSWSAFSWSCDIWSLLSLIKSQRLCAALLLLCKRNIPINKYSLCYIYAATYLQNT